MQEKWWYAIDKQGNIQRKSTNKTLLDQVAKLKGWTVKPASVVDKK